MVRLIATPSILSALEAIPTFSREELNLPDTLDLGNPVSHDQIIRISRYFRDKRGPNDDPATFKSEDRSFDLDSLLRGTKVYIPPPPPKPQPSPEYLALKARLLAAAESDAYNRMLQPQTTQAHSSSPDIFTSSTPALAALHDTNPKSSPDSEYNDPLTPSLVLNIFLSVLITGFSAYWALTSFQTPEILFSTIVSTWSPNGHVSVNHNNSGGASEPIRVLLSLFAALAVGIAEVAIYAIYLGKVEQAREKERKMKERKSVLQREEVRAKGTSAEDTSAPVPVPGMKDGEVIWGRGPNGGIRRRIREKWEEGKNGDKDEDLAA
ncbi:endoplasmic reticulum-based factor for assembly of V-ATPase-domain-containing protein [Aspergillus pseudoustus]|uniref:Endoplasmic reticulum-based factor for assembly of V-ATPase-domain-containing protein n=1 Tax=Aspergillus pseudoustus TaxID=1810923 RepID=A0ABR4KAZ6_9EURO